MTAELLRNGVTISQGYQSPAMKTTRKYHTHRVIAAFDCLVNAVSLQIEKPHESNA